MSRRTDALDGLPPLERWRLVLGEPAEEELGGLGDAAQAADAALDWLYGRDEELARREVADRAGGSGPSRLTVPEWIDALHRLFPRDTIERLERDAVEQFHLTEVITDPLVLAAVEPNPTLLKAVLQTRHLMNPEVLALARQLVARVVKQLMDALAREVQAAFSGTRDRRRSSPRRFSRSFDAAGTVRANLRHFDPVRGQLVIRRPLFQGRTRSSNLRWQILLLVDQSASMLDSTVHAAVTAACLWGIPGLKTHLIAFDTEVVDLTRDVQDPVEVLLKVQLGGGTHIGKAVRYAAQLVEAPTRALVVLVSDLYEGMNPAVLLEQVAGLVGQGSQVVCLLALDGQARPVYDRALALKLSELGAHVGAMTPGELAAFLAERVRG